jgi:acetaldehyde dehydrogenase (acetylating)
LLPLVVIVVAVAAVHYPSAVAQFAADLATETAARIEELTGETALRK